MFQGFPKEAVDFMWGIRFNNEKTWFEAHKQEYLDFFYRPMQELCQQVFHDFDPKCEELGLTSRVSRIYRDARRLHGRGPYKDHLWLSMEQPCEDPWSSKPVFWFELGPEDYSFGMGWYCARALTMAKLRARMDARPKEMEKLVRQFGRQSTFALEGEDFKRPREAPSALLSPWYNKKGGFSLSCDRPHEPILFTPELPDMLVAEWEKLLPLYRYFVTLDGDPDPRE